MPHRYPQEAVLRDGRRVLLRPFAEKDVDALYEFFQHLPSPIAASPGTRSRIAR